MYTDFYALILISLSLSHKSLEIFHTFFPTPWRFAMYIKAFKTHFYYKETYYLFIAVVPENFNDGTFSFRTSITSFTMPWCRIVVEKMMP